MAKEKSSGQRRTWHQILIGVLTKRTEVGDHHNQLSKPSSDIEGGESEKDRKRTRKGEEKDNASQEPTKICKVRKFSM